MGNIEPVLTAVETPSMALMKVNKIYQQMVIGAYNPSGVKILEEDWDNLIILDACRADKLQETIDMRGTFEQRTSRGTSTPHFVRSNFANRELRDLVYISANGWIVKLQDELGLDFHAIEFLDDTSRQDDEVRAITPAAVTERARQCADRYPHKRLIVHYVQPHKPYLGEFGRRTFGHAKRNLQQIMSSGEISESELEEAYLENLELVLSSVNELIGSLEGKSVITADHGELLGERVSPIPIKGYGHPDHIYHDALTEVPWFVCEYQTRREIREDTRKQETRVGEKRLSEHLKDLGYAV
ncbi:MULTISPECIES: hypothetical protein [Haloarcula]|uniref:hypothetical protein n=1 Tax=Haloarcula TaxID=2237 RepID=UPI0023ECE6B6|nr:hypothetical protein [Halomicroarcula sp. XH51]